MLEDESFCGCYQLDTQKRKFAKDKLKSVTLTIQLCSQRYIIFIKYVNKGHA